MKNITVRELKARPSHWLKVMREEESIIINGFEYAFVGRKGGEAVDHREIKEVKVVDMAEVRGETVDHELYRCDKCKGRYSQVFDHEEDGVDYVICGYCYKKVFRKFPKGFIF